MLSRFLLENGLDIIAVLSIAIAFYAMALYGKFVRKPVRLVGVLVALIVAYVFVVLSTRGLSGYLGWRLDSFDLNGDLVISGNEITEESDYLSVAIVQDTARSMIVFTGVIYAIIAVAIASVLRGCIALFRRLKA